jgi:hypothetical protein
MLYIVCDWSSFDPAATCVVMWYMQPRSHACSHMDTALPGTGPAEDPQPVGVHDEHHGPGILLSMHSKHTMHTEWCLNS